jgi:hypothetical protein
MKLLRSNIMSTGLLSFALVLAGAGIASAQGTTGGGPSTGGGTTGGPTTGGGTTGTTKGPNTEEDLPIGKPDFKGQPPKPPEDPPEQGDEKPPTIYGQEIKSENNTIFYVLDISGSMSLDTMQFSAPDGSTKSGNRLDRAKAELTKSVTSLPDNFKFNMLAYDCSIYPWQGAMQQADAAHKAAAVGWIYGQQPQGATGTGPACAAALKDANNKLVVLLTDGDPNCGAGDGWSDSTNLHRRMIKSANKGAVVNVYGIGATGSFKAFCMNVASDNGGTYTDVK